LRTALGAFSPQGARGTRALRVVGMSSPLSRIPFVRSCEPDLSTLQAAPHAAAGGGLRLVGALAVSQTLPPRLLNIARRQLEALLPATLPGEATELELSHEVERQLCIWRVVLAPGTYPLATYVWAWTELLERLEVDYWSERLGGSPEAVAIVREASRAATREVRGVFMRRFTPRTRDHRSRVAWRPVVHRRRTVRARPRSRRGSKARSPSRPSGGNSEPDLALDEAGARPANSWVALRCGR
jgi:hypothetical protein